MKQLFLQASKNAGLAMVKVKKYSPEILLAAGVIGFGATVYLAVKSKKKVEKAIDTFEANNSMIEEDIQLAEGNESALEALKADQFQNKLSMVKEVSVAVAPAVLCGVASVASVCGSYGILSKRLGVVGAAYAASVAEFDNYRGKISDRYGEEEERKIYHTKRYQEPRLDKNGNLMTDKKGNAIVDEYEVLDSDVAGGAQKFVFSAATSADFLTGDSEWNWSYLKHVEKMFNQTLQAKGIVYLNDVLKHLSMDIVGIGQLVGWTETKGPIDFGMKQITEGTTGIEECILLDFNTHGYVYNLM